MSSNIDWNDVIKKEARGINDEDLGEVQEVTNGFVLVQRGIINKEIFIIPQEIVESYDGDVLRFSISKEELSSLYQRDSFPESDSTSTSADVEPDFTSTESEEMTVPIIEEKLEVTKRIEEDRATITKEPITETKTLEVPVVHEEVSIERRKPTKESTKTSQEPISSKEEIEIPLKKEEVEVTKTPYVREEVVIKKKPVTETKEVTGNVTSQSIDRSGV